MRGLLAMSRFIDRVTAFIGRFVAWLVLAAVVISAGNAILRKAFSISSNAWLELQWYLFGAVFMMAAAYTLQTNDHIRIDILYAARSKRTQDWIDLVGHVLFLLPFTVLMIWLLSPYVWRSFLSGEVSQNAGGLLLWPAKLMLLAGFTLLFFQGLSEIVKRIAIMGGLIADPHRHTGAHAPLEDAALRQGEPGND
ncbi:MAG: TRAP transporter small permease subunit [Alphaproteobacteria bacterium]|nr:TRAP transporter small permease subunit [Alphaproteobacteria bacterium]